MIINWTEFLLPYEQAVEELTIKFKSLKKEYDILGEHSPIEYVEGRLKKVDSILDKAKRKGFELSQIEEKIEDIIGIRLNCRFVEDITACVNLIKSRNGFDLTILEERDYITNTKPSGYRSYHILFRYNVMTTLGLKAVKGELQIRTLAMNFWARIEHSLKYKYNFNIPDDIKQRLVASAEAAFNLDWEMSIIRDEIIEAQNIIKVKNALVDEILTNMKALCSFLRIERINDLNAQFIEIFDEGKLDKLREFNEQLKIMAQPYY